MNARKPPSPLAALTGDRRVWIMAGLGLGSGLIGTFIYETSPLWREASVGIVFGLVIAGYLFYLRLATPLRAAAFALLSAASWMAAERFAREFFDWLKGGGGLGSWEGALTGVMAGLLGAGLLAVLTTMLFRFWRRPELALIMTVTGGVFGALLAITDVVDSGLTLFPPWQAAVAVCLALGLPRPGTAKG